MQHAKQGQWKISGNVERTHKMTMKSQENKTKCRHNLWI